MRPSLRTFATHAPSRTPLINFPTRSHTPHPHPPTAHPSAPQQIIDTYASFASRLLASQADGSPAGSTPLAGPAGGAAAGKGFSESQHLRDAEYEGEWQLPARFRRSYAPLDAEIAAVESGGASVAPLVTKASKKSWYTPAEL